MSDDKKISRNDYNAYLDSEPSIKKRLDNFNLLLKNGDMKDAEKAGFVPTDNSDLDKLGWDLGNAPVLTDVWNSESKKYEK